MQRYTYNEIYRTIEPSENGEFVKLENAELMVSAVKKCAEVFRTYEEIHKAKLPKDSDAVPAIFPSPYADIEEKIKRNREMAELCENALNSK